MTDKVNMGYMLPRYLRMIADEIDGTKPYSYWDCWLMILGEMDEGNPLWREPLCGRSSYDAVKAELQRLYAIDKSVKSERVNELEKINKTLNTAVNQMADEIKELRENLNRDSSEKITLIVPAEGPHPTHQLYVSDSSLYDYKCQNCHNTDLTGGGWGTLLEPCPAITIKFFDGEHGQHQDYWEVYKNDKQIGDMWFVPDDGWHCESAAGGSWGSIDTREEAISLLVEESE